MTTEHTREERPKDHYELIKWNGWGIYGKEMALSSEPHVVMHPSGKRMRNVHSFMRQHLGTTSDFGSSPSITKEEAISKLPQPIVNEAFVGDVQKTLSTDQIRADGEARLTHVFGKNYRDLWRMRRGWIDRAPDLVILPHGHDDCVAIMSLAHKHDVVVIPFGGGTNVTGCVEPSPFEMRRMVVSVDMRRMTKNLSIDTQSRVAVFEAGVLGPDLDAQLAPHGFMLGHDPDSYQHSTLGGWIAAKGSGAYSNKYGDVEQMVLAMKVATPTGVIETPQVPRSAGPDLNALFVGSEGVLGIVTQATIKIEPVPQQRRYEGWLFPTFKSGFRAFEEVTAVGINPCTMRLYDHDETQMGFALKTEVPVVQDLVGKGIKAYLSKIKGFDLQLVSLCIVGFEGCAEQVDQDATLVKKIFRAAGAFPLGQGAGANWQEKKYDLPYMRDFTLNHELWSDVFETTTVYSKALPLWQAVKDAVNEVWAAEGHRGWIGCHTAHQYRHGCCLYFTYAGQQRSERDFETFLKIKRAATETMLRHGGALTHHHGIGYEHVPWQPRAAGAGALALLEAVKRHVDPKGICNPGKLIPPVRRRGETAVEHEARSGREALFDKMGLPNALPKAKL